MTFIARIGFLAAMATIAPFGMSGPAAACGNSESRNLLQR